MRAELGDFAGGVFADVNGDGNHDHKCAHKNQRHEPGRDVTDVQRVIKRHHVVDRRGGVQKDFCQPCDQDQDENENVIAFQSAPDRLQFRYLEAGQNQIFAHQLFPFALKQVAIFHHHRDKKMRLQHADSCAECVVETVPPRLDPEQHPNYGQVKKENDVWHVARRKRNGDNGGAAGDGPVRGDIQPLPPHHDPAHLTPIEMRHCVDVARVVNAPLEGDGPLLFLGHGCVWSRHNLFFNWITGFGA